MDFNASSQSLPNDIASRFTNYENALENLSTHVKKLDSQLAECISYSKQTAASLHKLQREHTSLACYTEKLETYCLEVDSNSRKKHLVITGVLEENCETAAGKPSLEEGSNENPNHNEYQEESSFDASHGVAFKFLSNILDTLTYEDIDIAFRVGRRGTTPRPMLVKFTKESTRNEISRKRKCLKEVDEYKDVYMNDDLPKKLNQQQAEMRAVLKLAWSKNIRAKKVGNKINVDNKVYAYEDLGSLPEGIRLSDVNTRLTPKGLAFSGQHVPLSNFYPAEIKLHGKILPTSEHMYQFVKATFFNDHAAAYDICRARKPQEAKKIGSRMPRNAQWDACKKGKMKEIVVAKFSQNQHLYHALIGTGTTQLIEATFDKFWGCGIPINSNKLLEGNWNGNNILGQILMECRQEFRRASGRDMVEADPKFSQPNIPIANQVPATSMCQQSQPVSQQGLNYLQAHNNQPLPLTQQLPHQSITPMEFQPSQMQSVGHQPMPSYGHGNTNMLRGVRPPLNSSAPPGIPGYNNRMQTPMQWPPPITSRPSAQASTQQFMHYQSQPQHQAMWQSQNHMGHSSPASTVSGFEQGARRVSYDPSQSPVFASN